MGWADLSCYGAPTIRTPHLDALAAAGCGSPNGYSAASVCSPTRFGLYTGRYPGRLAGGLQEPIGAPNADGRPPPATQRWRRCCERVATTPRCSASGTAASCRVQPDQVRLGRVLRQLLRRRRLLLQGQLHGDHDLYENEVEYESLRYYTDILTERAVEFVRRGTRPRGCSTSTSPPRTGRGRAAATRRERRDHRPHPGRRVAGVCSTTTAGRSRRTRDGREPRRRGRQGARRAASTGQLDDTWSCSPATTAANGSPTHWPLTGRKGS